ncbi:MAG: radical SAM family heme chaperone HemW [Pseudomonadota bacterium]
MNQRKAVRKDRSHDATGGQSSAIHKGREPTEDAPPCKAARSSPGLYLHVPFCTVKCPYCDFYTYPHRGTTQYVQAVVKEIQHAAEFGWKSDTVFASVFLGGGTPSLLSLQELKILFDRFRFEKKAEVTIEINPENVTAEKAKGWHDLGINRASLGVQSLDDTALVRLKRTHKAADSRKAFDLLRSAGFENVSIDLIFGLEGQTPKNWETTLREVLAWRPDHISAYGLTIEEKTRFAVEVRQGMLRLPPEEDQLRMFRATREILSDAGLPPYEISNYAKPGFESRHNLTYWTGGEYWGVGVSAHSFQRTPEMKRWWNVLNLPKYIEALGSGGLAIDGKETLSPQQHWNERMITGLRLTRGVDLKELEQQIGFDRSPQVADALIELIQSGHILRTGDRVTLTEAGVPISDEVFSRLLCYL